VAAAAGVFFAVRPMLVPESRRPTGKYATGGSNAVYGLTLAVSFDLTSGRGPSAVLGFPNRSVTQHLAVTGKLK